MMCMFVASFPAPSQAFCHLQYEKAGKAWYLSHVTMIYSENGENFQNKQHVFCILFNQLHAQHSVYTTVTLG